MTVTVYTKPACVQCNATYKALDKQGIAYEKVDISLDSEARDYVMALGICRRPWWWPAATTGPGSGRIASRRGRGRDNGIEEPPRAGEKRRKR